MWKPSTQSGSNNPAPADPQRQPSTPPPAPEYNNSTPKPMSSAAAVSDQATIGKSLVIKGEVTGSESLYIDGRVEGSIHLPGNRVTVGRNGVIAANITAREAVILGKVRGNVYGHRPGGYSQRRLADRRRDRPAHQHRGRRVLQGRNRYPQAERER